MTLEQEDCERLIAELEAIEDMDPELKDSMLQKLTTFRDAVFGDDVDALITLSIERGLFTDYC